MAISPLTRTRTRRRQPSKPEFESRTADREPPPPAPVSRGPLVPPAARPRDGAAAGSHQYRPPFEIEPYEQYIGLARLRAGWPEAGNWAPGVVIACGFQSVELLMILARDAMADGRAAARSNGRLERIVDVIVSAFQQLGHALTGSEVPEFARHDGAARPESAMAAVFAMMPSGHQQRLADAFGEAFGTLGYRLGIEHVFAGQPERPGPVLDYTARAAPGRIIDLHRRPLHGPEDRLFATVHQIAECWLNIAHLHLELALSCGQQGNWPAAAIQTRQASSAVTVTTLACRLLDTMVLRDYHHLRVLLRDGSGAQSQSARALSTGGRRLYELLDQATTAAGTTLIGVLDDPDAYLDFHYQQAALQDFGRRCQAFLFEHYLLAVNVLGADNMGGLGFPISTLAMRAAKPFFPMVDQAKYDYTIITNLRYADRAGAIILRNELDARPGAYAEPPDLPPASCPPGHVDRVSRQYFACIEAHDASGWAALFHPEGRLLDSPGGRPFMGPDRLRVFIDSMFNMLTDMRVTSLAVSAGPSSAEVDWSFAAVALGVPVSFSGRESFGFASDGRILQATIYWNPAEVAEQIWRAKAGPRPMT
jgi:hypothetical protein